MFRFLKNSASAFSKNALSMILVTIAHGLMKTITFFAILGIFLIFFFIMSILRLTENVLAFGVFGGILLLLYVYFERAYKGAAYRFYRNTGEGASFSLINYADYSIDNALSYFGIGVIELFVSLLVLAPILAVNIYVLKEPSETILILLGVFGAFLYFIVKFLFGFAYPAMANRGLGIFDSLKAGFGVIKRYPLSAFGLYFLHAINFFFLNLPMLILGVHFILHRISSTILFVLFTLVALGFSAVSFFLLTPLISNAFNMIYLSSISMAPASFERKKGKEGPKYKKKKKRK